MKITKNIKANLRKTIYSKLNSWDYQWPVACFCLETEDDFINYILL